MRRRRGKQVGSGKNLVGFRIDDVHYAVEIDAVREIIHPLPVERLGSSPDSVRGVADYRGEAVTVVDVRARFGLPPASQDRRSKWLVVRFEESSVALCVDIVTEVLYAEPSEHRAIPSQGLGRAAQMISAVFSHDDRFVFVVDLPRLLAVTDLFEVEQSALGGDS